jgi:hypothetical protein
MEPPPEWQETDPDASSDAIVGFPEVIPNVAPTCAAIPAEPILDYARPRRSKFLDSLPPL